MRIISGTHKGRKINPTKNLPIRPTTDRAKEALFNIINNKYYFEDKNILDLFSGSGNISFEFASRGVKEVTAVDNNSNCIKFIENTAKKLDLNVQAINYDGLKFAKNCKQKFNFIFADPPYSYTYYKELKNIIIDNNLVKKGGLLIFEHDKNIVFKNDNVSVKKYGNVHFSIFSF